MYIPTVNLLCNKFLSNNIIFTNNIMNELAADDLAPEKLVKGANYIIEMWGGYLNHTKQKGTNSSAIGIHFIKLHSYEEMKETYGFELPFLGIHPGYYDKTTTFVEFENVVPFNGDDNEECGICNWKDRTGKEIKLYPYRPPLSSGEYDSQVSYNKGGGYKFYAIKFPSRESEPLYKIDHKGDLTIGGKSRRKSRRRKSRRKKKHTRKRNRKRKTKRKRRR